MKKLGIFLLFLCFGCKMETDFTNTPTKKVEAYLSDIQAAKSEVLEDALNYEENFSSFSKEEYQKVLAHQFKGMIYEIREEKIDGSKATVDVAIEVYDRAKMLEDLKEETVENQIKELLNRDDRVNYSLTFHLTKEKETWKLEPLDQEDQEKLYGIYKEKNS